MLKLKLKHWHIALLTPFGLLALYYGSIPFVGPVYECVKQKGENGQPDSCSYWDAVTAFFLNLVGWLDLHNGIVAALAGIAVAWFTYALRVSTEKLWSEATFQRKIGRRSTYANLIAARAAKKSADAITTLERAYVYPSDIADNLGGAVNIRVYDPDDERAVFNMNIIVDLSFKNLGKTPAHLESGFIGLQFLDILGEDQKVYSADMEFNYALGASEETSKIRFDFSPEFTVLANRQIRDGAARVVLNGHIFYRDIWDKPHISVVRFEYKPTTGRLMPGKAQGNT